MKGTWGHSTRVESNKVVGTDLCNGSVYIYNSLSRSLSLSVRERARACVTDHESYSILKHNYVHLELHIFLPLLPPLPLPPPPKDEIKAQKFQAITAEQTIKPARTNEPPPSPPSPHPSPLLSIISRVSDATRVVAQTAVDQASPHLFFGRLDAHTKETA